MNSSPLFMSVAESTEILRPMTQFGCAQASSGVTLREARAVGVQERPARCGQQDALHAGRRDARRRVARQALEHRVVLAVDGQQRGAGLAHRLHQQRPGHDQRFLVGQQQSLAGARRGERGTQSRGADDGRHDAVDFRESRDFLERLGAGEHARRRAARAQLLLRAARPRRVRERGIRHRETQRLLGQLGGIAMRAERDDAEAIRDGAR